MQRFVYKDTVLSNWIVVLFENSFENSYHVIVEMFAIIIKYVGQLLIGVIKNYFIVSRIIFDKITTYALFLLMVF